MTSETSLIPTQEAQAEASRKNGSTGPREPLIKLRPPGRWTALRLSELFSFRDLLVALAQRDIKLRYKQTLLGVTWVVLQPLIAAGIFTFVFSVIAKLPSDGVPYFLLSFAGLLAWNLFNNILTRSSTCLVSNSHLISKVFFPRLILPVSTIGSSLIDFFVALAMMAVLLVVYRWFPPSALVLLPIWLLILSAGALGAGLWTSALSVSYRDVQYILPVATQVLLYASPIPYAASQVPKRLQSLYYLNPLSAPIEACRWSLLGTTPPAAIWLIYSSVFFLLLLLAGAIAFKRMERRFADVI